MPYNKWQACSSKVILLDIYIYICPERGRDNYYEASPSTSRAAPSPPILSESKSISIHSSTYSFLISPNSDLNVSKNPNYIRVYHLSLTETLAKICTTMTAGRHFLLKFEKKFTTILMKPSSLFIHNINLLPHAICIHICIHKGIRTLEKHTKQDMKRNFCRHENRSMAQTVRGQGLRTTPQPLQHSHRWSDAHLCKGSGLGC